MTTPRCPECGAYSATDMPCSCQFNHAQPPPGSGCVPNRSDPTGKDQRVVAPAAGAPARDGAGAQPRSTSIGCDKAGAGVVVSPDMVRLAEDPVLGTPLTKILAARVRELEATVELLEGEVKAASTASGLQNVIDQFQAQMKVTEAEVERLRLDYEILSDDYKQQGIEVERLTREVEEAVPHVTYAVRVYREVEEKWSKKDVQAADRWLARNRRGGDK